MSRRRSMISTRCRLPGSWNHRASVPRARPRAVPRLVSYDVDEHRSLLKFLYRFPWMHENLRSHSTQVTQR